MKQYGAYMASPATKTTSAILEVKIDKILQFQVNWISISRDTSVKAQPEIHLKILNFHSFHNSDPNIFIQDPFTTST